MNKKVLVNYVLIDRQEKERLLDVNILRGGAGGLSNHHLVAAKLKVGCECVKRPKEGARSKVKEFISPLTN